MALQVISIDLTEEQNLVLQKIYKVVYHLHNFSPKETFTKDREL